MTLDDALVLVAGSSPSDWSLVYAPVFLSSFSTWTAWDDDHRETRGIDVNDHYLRAAYRPDVSLGLAYGLAAGTDGDGGPERLTFDWAEVFADQNVTRSWADILWNGMLIHRSPILSVDGGRALLPDPRPEVVGSGMHVAKFADTISRLAVAIARTVHSLEHRPQDYESYLTRAGFIVGG